MQETPFLIAYFQAHRNLAELTQFEAMCVKQFGEFLLAVVAELQH